MLISLFTPTHNTQFLGETYSSLLAQTCGDWEWVIVPNDPAKDGKAIVPEAIARDPRVKIFPAPDMVARLGVGALKRFACERATGSYLIELDHDDILAPDCLSEIISTARTTGAGFIYSDFANFLPDGKSGTYNLEHGWTQYEVEIYGRKYLAMRSFPPTPDALVSIYYAPNHVRAWSREAYWRAGGHDPSFRVADDHDLITRTYLTGCGFHHIEKCLYLYRMHEGGGNTYIQHNAEIVARTQQIGQRDIGAIVAQWCAQNNLPMLDLGGAHNRTPGYLAVDLDGGDVNCDIRFGLPYADNSVGCIRAYDFLEHINHCPDSTCTHGNGGKSAKCVVGIMNECYRVLAPGGWMLTRTPSTDGRGAFQDPTHVSFWNPNSFWYYTRREQANFVRGIHCRFQGNRIWQDYPSEWHKAHNILYVYANLVALKGQRVAGVCEI
ncbi:MAG: glycosyltransferase [Betaproteobacteria bacterium]|nr:MAG: glycosyltransferase [Betaproteobacteria bacterium]